MHFNLKRLTCSICCTTFIEYGKWWWVVCFVRVDSTVAKPACCQFNHRLYWYRMLITFFTRSTSWVAWLRLPTYFRSVFISLHYVVWVCGIFTGFLKTKMCRSNQRTEGVAENDDVEVASLSMSPHDQTFIDWLWQIWEALGRVSAFKEIHAWQWKVSRLSVHYECTRVW